MDTTMENENEASALNDNNRAHIEEINRQGVEAGNQHIEADVILVWPYSSSTQELSLLLAEHDVSIRKATGQVKVTLHSTCAREVAKSRIGIGETIKLSLRDAQLFEESDNVSTPGKKAAFTLHYARAVQLEIHGPTGQRHRIDFVAPSLPAPIQNGSAVDFGTPAQQNIVDIPHTKLPAASTPALKTGSRLSSNSFPGSFVDPFAEEDGSVPGRGRKRTKFGRHSGAWRWTDAEDEEDQEHDQGPPTPLSILTTDRIGDNTEERPLSKLIDDTISRADLRSPSQEEIPNDRSNTPTSVRKHDNKVASIESPDTLVIPSSPIADDSPSSSPRQVFVERPSMESGSMPTPRLQALGSSELDLVSPLISRTHFSATFQPHLSELDASAQVSDAHESGLSAEGPSSPVVPVQHTPEFATGEDQTGKEAAPMANDQLVVHPTAASQGEVDLDALQAHIELSSAQGIPEMLEQAIEDDDLYGPHVGDDLRYEKESIEQPQEVQTLFETPAATVDEPIVIDDESSVESEQEASPSVESSERTTVSEMVSPALDGATDHPDDTYTPHVTELVPHEAMDGMPEFRPAPTKQDVDNACQLFSMGSRSPRSFDGASDGDMTSTEHSQNVVAEATINEDLAMNTELEHHPHINLATNARHVMAAADEHVETEIEDIHSLDMGTERRERPSPHVNHIESNPPQQQAVPLQDLPLTPLNSQEPSKYHLAKFSEQAQEIPQLPESSDFSGFTPARRASRRLKDRSAMSDGLYSEYFTPRKSRRATTEQQPSLEEAYLRADDVLPPATDEPHIEPADSPPSFLTSAIAESLVDMEIEVPPSHGSRTELGYYVHLKFLDGYYNQLVDVLAVCTADSIAPERAQDGPKDFHTTIHLADASFGEDDNTITAQIFRPRKNVIPVLQRGDVVILRNFKVQSQARKPFLLSTDESAWAVFHLDEDEILSGSMTAITSGPPVEYGLQEKQLVHDLSQWWSNDGQAHYVDLPPQSQSVRRAKESAPSAPKAFSPHRPPPLDLRRSSRRTRQSQNSPASDNISASSPTCYPVSPTYSQNRATDSVPPASAPIASPTSPNSVMTTRSSRSASILAAARASTRKGNSRAQSPPPTLEALPEFSRPSTRSTAQGSISPHPAIVTQQEMRTDVSDIPNPGASREFSPSDGNSVVVTTEADDTTIASVRRHRHERRSTGLIHELRDGLQWVDVEETEIVSVSSGDEDPDGDDQAQQLHNEAISDAGETIESDREGEQIDSREELDNADEIHPIREDMSEDQDEDVDNENLSAEPHIESPTSSVFEQIEAAAATTRAKGNMDDEEETDEELDADKDTEAEAEAEDSPDELATPQVTPSTPSRNLRGRPRKELTHKPGRPRRLPPGSAEKGKEQEVVPKAKATPRRRAAAKVEDDAAPAIVVEPGPSSRNTRLTRSKSKATEETIEVDHTIENVHELRDGARYQDK